MSAYNGLPLAPLMTDEADAEKKRDLFWRMMFIVGISNEEALKYIHDASPTSFNTYLNMQWNGHNLKNCIKDVQEISIDGDDDSSPSRKRRVSFNVTSAPNPDKQRLPVDLFDQQTKIVEQLAEQQCILNKLKDLTLAEISYLRYQPRL